MTEATWTNPGGTENTGCQQAERDPESQIIADPPSEDEGRRFMALDQAIRGFGEIRTTEHAEQVTKNAAVFEAYLSGHVDLKGE